MSERNESTSCRNNNDDAATIKASGDVLITFQQWVRTLDWNDIQNYLVFRIRRRRTTTRSFESTSIRTSKQNRLSGQHRDEYDMIQDMVRLQVPLPTPIHPRAIPYEPASHMGKNYEEKSMPGNKVKTRRWLQFICNTRNDELDESAEEKLWAMLRQNQNGHDFRRTSKNLKSPHKKDKKKVKSNGTSSIHLPTNETHNHYSSMDIIARQFRLDDGTVLTSTGCGGGCIDPIWDADTTILEGTSIQSIQHLNDDNYNDNDTMCHEEYICRFYYDRWTVSSNDTVHDHTSTTNSNNNNSSRSHCNHKCYDLLRYSSRGAFASNIVLERQVDEFMIPISFPSWFDPTQRWFPLSMYLTARYEIALWRAFYNWLYHRSFQTVPTILFQHPNEPERSTFQYTLALSLSKSIKHTFCTEKRKLLTTPSFHIRDMLYWNELVNMTALEHSFTSQKRWNGNNLSVSPLLELGTSVDEIRQQVRNQMQLVLTDRAMEQLLLSDDVTGTISDETSTVSNITNRAHIPPRKQRKGKKKSKRRNDSIRTSQQSNVINLNVYTTFSIAHDDPSSSSSDGDDVHLAPGVLSKSGQRIVRNNSHISDRDRSRHTMLALSIIEDILDNVFHQVGKMSVDASIEAIDESTTYSMHDLNVENNQAEHDLDLTKDQNPIFYSTKTNEQHPNDDVHEIRHIPTEYDVWDATRDRIVPAIYPQHESAYSQRPQYNLYPGDPSATIRTSNLQGFSSIEYNSFTPGFFKPPDVLNDTNLEIQRYLSDGWGRHQGIGRNESLLTNYFHKQDKNDVLVASSTAASIASSDKGNDHDTALEVYDFDCEELASIEAVFGKTVAALEHHITVRNMTPTEAITDPLGVLDSEDKSRSGSEFHSPSPPSTPSPTLSPILVSLSELGELPIEALELLQIPSTDLIPVPVSSDLTDAHAAPSSIHPSEPVFQESVAPAQEFVMPKLKTSSSRENLRTNYRPNSSDSKTDAEFTRNSVGTKLDKKSSTAVPLKCRDDHDIVDKATVRRSADALKSYRNIVMSRSEASKLEKDIPPRELKKFPSNKTISAIKSSSTYPNMIESPRRSIGKFHFDFSSSLDRSDCPSYSRSDIDGNDEYQNLRDGSATRVVDNDNFTVTKDGATTISSGTSQRESEEVTLLREQRNVYRDMCLTLGSEVAKLKNVLAAQACTSFQPVLRMQSTYDFQAFPVADSFDPRVFHIAPRAQTLAALSDAGYRGEYESLASEDEVAVRMVSSDNIMHLSSGLTLNATDQTRLNNNATSADQLNPRSHAPKSSHDAISPNFLQSRLARDIFQFLERNTAQLRQLDGKIQAAVERMGRLVKTVWPRAQVKLYGSHVTGLSVVSSDLDFVVCLPAVHKNDIAVAPGALEGRNAINETSQKLLARRLKGESWIDPRSMKLIDRTAVPVIKVSTKDTKKHTLHLDISFDGPGHHGLESAQMISSIMNELPMLRPLVVVLKQFLIERSLLEAYTGMYCIRGVPFI